MIPLRRLACAAVLLALAQCAPRSKTDATRPPADVDPSDDEGMGLTPTIDADDPPPAASRAAHVDRPPATIFRDELERATARGPAYVLRELGPEPFRHHGVFVGWEVTRLFPDDPSLCAPGCDIDVGDVILSVNGSRLETPQAFAEAFETLEQADRLVVHSLREGKRRERTYRIVAAGS